MVKRFIDIMASAILLITLSPLFVVLAITNYFFVGAPILFKQARAGIHGKLFTIYKFKTMREAYDVSGKLLSDDIRLTPYGRWLRRASLDELPQLLNVLKGEISLVGPRPLLVEYLPLYNAEQLRRHEVKPGITGWAQVNGRNKLSWEEKFALDVWYVDNHNLWVDIRILLYTLLHIIRPSGITQEGNATMSPFTGSGQKGVEEKI
jgi:sugar transferase EpsL